MVTLGAFSSFLHSGCAGSLAAGHTSVTCLAIVESSAAARNASSLSPTTIVLRSMKSGAYDSAE